MKRAVLVIVWLLVVLSFLTTPLTGDFMVFWAYARQVHDSMLNGLAAIVDIWELKGMLFRIIVYCDYLLTTIFINDYGLLCMFIYKLFGLIVFLFLLYLSILFIPCKYMDKSYRRIAFFVTSILLLTVHFACHLQPEMWGVLFLILAFSLYLHDSIWHKVIAAIVFSSSFYLKSPIPLLGGTLFFGIILIKKKTLKESFKELIPFALTSAVFLIFFMFLVRTFYPQEITDIWDASYYQQTLFHSGGFWGSFKQFLKRFFIYGIFNNITCVLGLASTIWLLCIQYKKKEYMNSVYLILLWIFPMIYIILSNKFFVYHYYLLIFPTIITLFLLFQEIKKTITLDKLFLVPVGLYLCFFIILLSAVAPINIERKINYADMWKRNKIEKNIYVGCQLDSDEVLYLDAGLGAFIFTNKSYLRYFYPLPLQRIGDKDSFAKTKTYKDVKEKVMKYNGKYITLDDKWFFWRGHEDIKQKISNEYELIEVIDYPIFSWDLFSTGVKSSKLSLYKRKR